MQIDVFQRSVSDPDLSIGLAHHRGTHYRFIASNSDGKVVRLEVWGADEWIIEAARPAQRIDRRRAARGSCKLSIRSF